MFSDFATYMYDSVIYFFDHIYEVIVLASIINFWGILLIIFLQNWELLVSYTTTFNTKYNLTTFTKNILVIVSKLHTSNTDLFTKYYL